MVGKDYLYSIFINLLSLNLKPNVWSILESFPCALEKNMYPVVVGYSILYVLDLVDLLFCLNVLFPYSSSVWLFHPLL